MCTARPRLLVALYAFNPHVGHRGTPAPDFALNRAVSQLGASLVLTGSAWCLPDGCWHGPFVHPEAILPIVVAGLARPRPARLVLVWAEPSSSDRLMIRASLSPTTPAARGAKPSSTGPGPINPAHCKPDARVRLECCSVG